jgi:transglutaminase-like putative cysteine protease
MHICVGYDLIYHCPQETPMILLVTMHDSRASDLVAPDDLITDPAVPITAYRGPFGNWCTRLVAPAGQMRFTSRGVVRDSGQPDVVVPAAPQHAVEDLPAETLVFLRGSRYCETDVLSPVAWDLFDKAPPGWARVQAICDYVHHHITFGYEYARCTKTA